MIHLAAAVLTFGLPSLAHAEDALPTWNVGLRFPWQFTFAADHPQVGLGGFGLDVEHLAGGDSYVGVGGELGLAMDVGQAAETADSAMVEREKLGVEMRHVFHEGTASASVDNGPCFPIPRHDWIGARAGYETLDGGDTHGYFGEVSLGTDPDLGHLSLGMYLTAGVSVEPAAAYALPAMPDDAALARTPGSDAGDVAAFYLGFGVSLGLH